MVGLLLLLFNIAGGASTFMLGIAFTRCKTSLDVLLRIQFAGALAMAVGFLLQFLGSATPTIVGGGILFRVGYAIEDLPQTMLSARLPVDTADLGRYPNLNVPVINLGGNPNLTPEKSNSYTFGAVFQPKFLRGFDLTVDCWNIDISNVITALPYLSILNLCVDSPAGINNLYCSLINRNAAGQIVTVQANTYNLAALGARGIDIGANLRRPIGSGLLRLGFNGTYLLKQTVLGNQGVTGINYAGEWNYPRFKATLLTDYAVGKFTFGLNTRFISRSVYDVTDASPETRSPHHVPAYIYNDLTVRFRPTNRYALTFGVKNISDVGIFGPLQDTGPGPNSSGGAQMGAAYYDPIGRYFFAKIDLNF